MEILSLQAALATKIRQALRTTPVLEICTDEFLEIWEGRDENTEEKLLAFAAKYGFKAAFISETYRSHIRISKCPGGAAGN